MKRSLAVMGSILVLGLGLASCGGDDDDAAVAPDDAPTVADVEFTSPEAEIPVGYEEPDPSAEPVRFAYLNALGANELLSAIGSAFEAETERLGGTVQEFDARLDPDRQVSQFQQVLAQGVDGIFVRSVDPDALEPLIRQAENRDIPVVTMSATTDADDPGAFLSQIWDRRDEIAFRQLELLARQAGEGATVAHITTEIPAPTLQQVIEEHRKWAREFGIEIAGNADARTDDPEGGEGAASGLLTRFPDVDAILPYNDPTGIGASAAARAQGMPDLPIVGVNGGSEGLEAVRTGRMSGTVRLDAVGLGRFGAWGLLNAIAGEDIPPTVRSGDLIVVDEANVDEVQTWDEEIEAEYGAG